MVFACWSHKWSRALALLAVMATTLLWPAGVFASCDEGSTGGGETGGGTGGLPTGGGGGGSTGGSGGGGSGCTPPARNPILFIHGIASDGLIWDTMINWFKAEPGWTWSNQPLYTWSYDWSQSNKDTAYEIQARVNSILNTHCASKIDLVTHSMGGLSSRWYIKWLAGGSEKVDDWVSLAGPNHGTTKVPWSGPGLACTWIQFWSGAYPSCNEMATGSSFLFSLNEGDETPWAVSYATWRTECEQWVDPRTSTSVAGAANGVVTWACPDHSGIYKDRGVYERVRNFVY